MRIICYLQEQAFLPEKVATATTKVTKIFDESFTKNHCIIHPTIFPFLTTMELNDTAKKESNSDEDDMSDDNVNKVPTGKGNFNNVKLQPYIAPINHNTLDFSKAFNIIHTLMGNFCHGDKDKISQREEMGNDACVLMGYHNKVCIEISCQIIHIVNNLFCQQLILLL